VVGGRVNGGERQDLQRLRFRHAARPGERTTDTVSCMVGFRSTTRRSIRLQTFLLLDVMACIAASHP
jgi:hypothetical protein